MSDLLFTWLNDELQLSKRVINFEEDFHNGYLFGQILSKYNQQLNFSEFINKDDKASRIKNFELLFDTIKALKVGFDSHIVIEIIDKKSGVAKKVLYQLKMQLQKTNVSSANKLNKGTKTLTPLKKIQLSKDKFDQVNKDHFKKQVNELHRAQKTILEENLQKKFVEFHTKQLDNINTQQNKEMQSKLMERSRFRQKQLENIKKSSQFRTQWENTNKQKWAHNMTVRKTEAEKDLAFHSKIQNSKLHSQTMSQINALTVLDKDIDAFQRKFLNKNQRKDSDSSGNEEQKTSKLKLEKQPSKITGKINLTANNVKEDEGLLKKKRSMVSDENAKHQREKRRRKMIVELNKRNKLIEIGRRQSYMISTIQQTSKQEKELEYEIWRAWQNKEVIIQNSKLIGEKIKEKEETRTINKKFKNQQLLKTYRTEHELQMKSGLERQKKLKSDNQVKARKDTYADCWNIISSLIDITEQCYEFSQQANTDQLSEASMDHLFAEFMHNAQTPKDIANLELTDYIQGKGEWKIPVKVQATIPTDPHLDNAVARSSINNEYLGNILKVLFQKFYKNQGKQPQIKRGIQLQKCVSILGLQFAGKKFVSEQLSKKYGVNTIIVDKLISKRLQEYHSMKEKMLEVSRETEEIVQLCYSGKDIPNSLILSLIKEQLRKNPRSILLDFPLTYQQATQLTQLLTGIKPSDQIGNTDLVKKIQDFSRFAKPTASISIPRNIRPCGLDFTLWINVSQKTSLDRFLGRRWVKDQIYSIHEEIEDVNMLQVGPKASPQILKNNFKINNRKNVENWFRNFGMEVQDGEITLKQESWVQVSGECSKKDLLERVVAIWDKVELVKQKLGQENKKNQTIIEEQNKKMEEEIKHSQELKLKKVFTNRQKLKQELEKAKNSVDLDPQYVKQITGVWNSCQSNTANCLLQCFQRIRGQQQSNNKYIAEIKRSYIGLLTREDEKFYLVKKFQNEYNKFFDQLADMIGYEYTKEQLHQRVEDLEDSLFRIVEEKKEEAVEERNSIMTSGWLEMQLEQFFLCVQVIIQAQLQRTAVSQQIIMDFYSKRYNIEQKEIEEYPLEVNIDSTIEIIKDQSCPRLEKLVSEATRLFNREEEQVDDKNKKGGKAPPKKDDKKPAKKGGKEEVEEKAEPTPQEIEMKKAINTQKSIFRYRINVINTYATQKIKNISERGKKLYRDLEDLYLYTLKVQNKSIQNLTAILKKCIENEQKIQNELQINYVEVVYTELIRNFQKHKPIILSAEETVTHDRFTISNLRSVISLIKDESESNLQVNTKRLFNIFEKLVSNDFLRVMLPETWKAIKIDQYVKFTRILDSKNTGYVELWKIFMFLIMTNFTIPTPDILKKYKLNLTNFNDTIYEVDYNQFIACEAWFDQQIQSPINMRVFQRNRHIKQLLFELFGVNEPNKIINISKYLECLSLTTFNYSLQAGKSQTYYEFSFGGM